MQIWLQKIISKCWYDMGKGSVLFSCRTTKLQFATLYTLYYDERIQIDTIFISFSILFWYYIN